MLPATRRVLTLLLLSAPLLCPPSVATAEDLPEEIERQIDEKTEGMPDAVRDAIKRATAKKIAEMKAAREAAGQSASDGEESPSDEKTDEEDGDKKKPASKPSSTPLSAEAKKLKAEMDLYDMKLRYKVHEYKKQLETQVLMLEKSKLDRKLEAERLAAAKEAMSRERDRLKLEYEIAKAKAEFEKTKLEAELIKLAAEKRRIEAQVEVESAKESLEDRVLGDERYPDEPFADGVLSISPRRIELNGPIMRGAADYVCQRLDYFNNRSTKPIFLVIDSSPGGSAIEGMQILQGIRESHAPVHVVVKRFAASMAAIITTLADHSYCYPNAIILHHQASTVLAGNGRAMEDQKRQFDEISRRLIGAVAKKIGSTEKEFIDQMYQNRVSGDWDVFGDQAVDLKWVDRVVELVREESIRRRPKGMRGTPTRVLRLAGANPPTAETPEHSNYLERYQATLVEETDAQGRPFVRLPRTGAIDAWLIYNPDRYYR